MTWTKLSDDFTDDCWTLTDAAYRLHTEALVWSNRKLLDCKIPASDVMRITRNTESVSESVSELLSKGFWLEDGDDYRIRHHSIYQRTRAQVVAQQAANQQNGAKGGRPRKPGRELETQSVSELLSDSKTETETERDGTGQDKNAFRGDHSVSVWPAVKAVPLTPGPGNPSCRMCGKPNLFHPKTIERGVCASCLPMAMAKDLVDDVLREKAM